MRLTWRSRFVCISFATLLVAFGCNRGPQIRPVSGRVTFQGEPLALGGITFEPVNGRSAFGRVREGEIVDVTTFEPGDGVLVGTARVGIQSTTNLGKPVGPHTPLIPPAYFDPNTSNIVVEISADKANELLIELR